MNFIISANTDIGIAKSTNQDSLSVKIINTPQGNMAFGLLCDGMGGLSKGEVASASVIRAFDKWIAKDLPLLCKAPIDEEKLKEQWTQILREQNHIIGAYGTHHGVRMGTTAVVMLLTQTRYCVMNVGDSRAYELTEDLKQITKDQTFVEREVDLGHITAEQAETDERRSVLLQCVGASSVVNPDMFCDDVKENAVYMMCSDGFRHEITPQEIYDKLNPQVLQDSDAMSKHATELIELNKSREERDNISVLMIKTC